MMTKIFLTSLFALTAATATAQESDFSAIDSDASGSLSLAEVQAVAPNVTAEEFATYDADGSGDLSEDEFTAWTTPSTDESTPQ